jgi:hypothetical protein
MRTPMWSKPEGAVKVDWGFRARRKRGKNEERKEGEGRRGAERHFMSTDAPLPLTHFFDKRL